MPWKMNGDAIVVEGGNPVWIHDDKKEIPFDAAHTLSTIGRLNGEAKSHRERAEAVESNLKKFEGIADPDAAKKALETVANLDEGKLLTAGKVEEIKASANKAAEDRIKQVTTDLTTKLDVATRTAEKLQGELYGEKVGGAFARSKFITDKLAIPSDIAQARFGGAFKIEDGKIVAYDANGAKVGSRLKIGSDAEFEEAIEILVDSYPNKDHILRGTGGGSGGRPGSGGGAGDKTITRSAFDQLSSGDKAAKMRDGTKVIDAV